MNRKNLLITMVLLLSYLLTNAQSITNQAITAKLIDAREQLIGSLGELITPTLISSSSILTLGSLQSRKFIVSNLEDNKKTNAVAYHPNPFTDRLQIRTKKEIDKVEILNNKGKVVISALNKTTLNTSFLLNGTYVIRTTFFDLTIQSESIIKN